MTLDKYIMKVVMSTLSRIQVEMQLTVMFDMRKTWLP